MNTLKTVWVLGLLATSVAYSQTTTDQYGTTFLSPGTAVAPTVQNPAANPLQSNRFRRGVVRQNPNFSAVDIAPPAPTQELLLNQLLGVVLVPTPGDVRPEGCIGVEGVWHDFKDFPAEVGWALQGYLRKPVSLTTLDDMVRDVIVAYRDSDRPVVDVLLPEQDITTGVVQLIVIESKLGRVRVEGVDVNTEEYISSQMRSRKGDVIRSSDVLSDLAWINRSPYRKVDLAYAPGAEFGTTDIILKPGPETQKKARAFIGYEDSGSSVFNAETGESNFFLGKERLTAGGHIAELGSPGQSLSYQFTSDLDFEHLRAHSFVFSKDLPWRHNLTLFASFAEVDGTIPLNLESEPDAFLRAEGFNWSLSGRYNIPLKTKETHICEPLIGSVTRRRDAYFGFDFKSNDNDLEFGGFNGDFGNGNFPVINPSPANTEIYQFTAGYSEKLQWKRAVSQFNIGGVFSPGNFRGDHNTDEVFQVTVPGSSSEYFYLTAGFEHQIPLLQDWSARFRGSAQFLADGPLQASEQFGIGGHDRIRGFDSRIARGDNGGYISAEVYTPELSLGRILDWPNQFNDKLRFLAFIDSGSVENEASGSPNQSIASTGVGMRYSYNDGFNLRVDFGHPIVTDNVVTNESGRFHIGATANF